MYVAFLIPSLFEEPNRTQITPPEPIGIIINSDWPVVRRVSPRKGGTDDFYLKLDAVLIDSFLFPIKISFILSHLQKILIVIITQSEPYELISVP